MHIKLRKQLKDRNKLKEHNRVSSIRFSLLTGNQIRGLIIVSGRKKCDYASVDLIGRDIVLRPLLE